MPLIGSLTSVCDCEKGFGGRYLRPGFACIVRHLRQSFKGERIRVQYAKSVRCLVGEHLAPSMSSAQGEESARSSLLFRRILKFDAIYHKRPSIQCPSRHK